MQNHEMRKDQKETRNFEEVCNPGKESPSVNIMKGLCPQSLKNVEILKKYEMRNGKILYNSNLNVLNGL